MLSGLCTTENMVKGIYLKENKGSLSLRSVKFHAPLYLFDVYCLFHMSYSASPS